MERELQFNNKTGLQKTQDTYFMKISAAHTHIHTHTVAVMEKTGEVR